MRLEGTHEPVEITEIFFALSDKTRRAILTLLVKEDLTVSSISDRLGLKIASTSKHLQILIRSLLVRQRKHGQSRLCSIELKTFGEAQVWIYSIGSIDLFDLEKLEDVLIKQGLA